MKLNPKNAVITGLAAFLLAAGVSSCSHAEPHTYSLDVVLWRDMGGVASFVDADGNVWEMDSENWFGQYDNFEITLDDQGTGTQFDDKIVAVRAR